MKLYLFLMCLTGFVPVALSVAHCYHLITTPMTWSDARSYCRQTYVDLAEINSTGDWLRIAAEAFRKLMISPAWIGLYNDLDSWQYSLNSLPLKNTTFTNWAFSQPTAGNDACGVISYTGTWTDSVCTALYPFVCYDSHLGFISYLLPLNWFGAQTYCRIAHTDLATAATSADNNDIKNKLFFPISSWFGLFRNTWTWLSGTVASNLLWALFQPDNLFGAQNCATYTAGLISDETCSSQFAFFCHSTPPVRLRKIIRLQLRSDGSALDSSMQSIISEQLNQLLKNNGLNTTMTWRVRKDNSVFCKKPQGPA